MSRSPAAYPTRFQVLWDPRVYKALQGFRAPPAQWDLQDRLVRPDPKVRKVSQAHKAPR